MHDASSTTRQLQLSFQSNGLKHYRLSKLYGASTTSSGRKRCAPANPGIWGGEGGGWLGCLIQIKKNILSFSSHVYCTIEKCIFEFVRSYFGTFHSSDHVSAGHQPGTQPCLGYHGPVVLIFL